MENTLLVDKHVLLYLEMRDEDLPFIITDFCGVTEYSLRTDYQGITIYFCGNVELVEHIPNVIIIGDFCYNNSSTTHKVISWQQVPRNVNNVGMFVDRCFEPGYYDRICADHEFQNLTESNKPSNAFRTGVYVTDVAEINNGTHFHLLRCSSNFSGPTCGKEQSDMEIMETVNNYSEKFYKQSVDMNHALIQKYNNNTDTGKKAAIKQHSDKTKDMPANGLLAFCTFYNDDDITEQQTTKMRFKLKSDVEGDYIEKFDVVFTPNSLFIISLHMNRLYTHEIIPGQLEAAKLPTRIGYVLRASTTLAIWRDNKTYIIKDCNENELIEPYDEGVNRLKDIYYQENMTSNKVTYEGFDFSLNKGDYTKPNIGGNKSDSLTVQSIFGHSKSISLFSTDLNL